MVTDFRYQPSGPPTAVNRRGPLSAPIWNEPSCPWDMPVPPPPNTVAKSTSVGYGISDTPRGPSGTLVPPSTTIRPLSVAPRDVRMETGGGLLSRIDTYCAMNSKLRGLLLDACST